MDFFMAFFDFIPEDKFRSARHLCREKNSLMSGLEIYTSLTPSAPDYLGQNLGPIIYTRFCLNHSFFQYPDQNGNFNSHYI